jgi:CheY-like chemotaxis protein
LSILVIDDEQVFLKTMARRLSPHEVRLASDAVEAFAILDEQAADVIFCDLNLPRVRGLALYEYLRRIYPGEEERLVFMTGEPILVGARAYLSSLSNPVLQKPISKEALEAALARCLVAPRFDISRASPPLRRGA